MFIQKAFSSLGKDGLFLQIFSRSLYGTSLVLKFAPALPCLFCIMMILNKQEKNYYYNHAPATYLITMLVNNLATVLPCVGSWCYYSLH